MAGSLIKVDEFTISSPVASVILGGGSSGSSGLNASIDSTYDVYMVRVNNVAPDVANRILYMRVTESGTPNTTANYDYAYKGLRADAAFANLYGTNITFWQTNGGYGSSTGTGQTMNGIFYLFNFNNASEYSFITNETTNVTGTPSLRAGQGGGVFTSTSSCDGLYFYFNADNINSGVFTLYGLKK